MTQVNKPFTERGSISDIKVKLNIITIGYMVDRSGKPCYDFRKKTQTIKS
jgi:hypothetical protein